MNAIEIGEMIQYFRKKAGLTQRELAMIAGVGKTVVFDIEKGKETVQLNSVLKILMVLNIKLKFETPFAQQQEDSK